MNKTKYVIGVWNDNPGGSRFGEPTRNAKSFVGKIRLYKTLGISGIEAHDNEIVPDMVPEVRKVLQEEGMFMAMYTPNMFWRKEYANGALASHDPQVRKMAVKQFKRAIDTAHELEAALIVYWNGQEGSDVAFGKDGVEALGYLRDGFNEILAYDSEQYGDKALRIAIEPKPNEPRCHMLLPTVGDALAFAYSLDVRYNDRVGVNPETAHSLMVGLDYVKDLETALFHNRLFHIHLNDQESPKYDQDLPFASVNPKLGLEAVATLERHNYNGLVAFDLNPLRTDSEEMRSNIIKASIRNYERLCAIAETIDWGKIEGLRAAGAFSELDMYIDKLLIG